MEPLKPEEIDRILAERPQAAPEDIDEYQRLLSERFRRDPELQGEPGALGVESPAEQRLRELYVMLFG